MILVRIEMYVYLLGVLHVPNYHFLISGKIQLPPDPDSSYPQKYNHIKLSQTTRPQK